jgi:hypothetical protein
METAQLHRWSELLNLLDGSVAELDDANATLQALAMRLPPDHAQMVKLSDKALLRRMLTRACIQLDAKHVSLQSYRETARMLAYAARWTWLNNG